jgi:UTP--glucose-1-phosphate uridylyltransferase
MAGAPLLSRVVGEAVEAGIRKIIAVASPRNEGIVSEWLDALLWGLEGRRAFPATVVIQGEPRGIGDALLLSRPAVGSDPFAVLLPDNVFWGGASPLQSLMLAAGEIQGNYVGLVEVSEKDARLFSNSGLCQVTRLTDHVFRIDQLQDKGPGALRVTGSRLKTCGRQLYQPSVWRILEGMVPAAGEEFDDVELLQALARRGDLMGVKLGGTLYDVGNPAGYRAACRHSWEGKPWWR